MRIRKRNNVIYWLGFSLYFIPYLIIILYSLFKSENFSMTLQEFNQSIFDDILGVNNLCSPIYFLDFGALDLPLFSWIRTFVNFLMPYTFGGEDYMFVQIIGSFVAWVLFYNEIWLFIRVFLWFFDIPNEILERSVNIV